MNKEICKNCKMYPEYFIRQYYLGHKKDIVKHYFFGYNKGYYEENLDPCLIIETSNKNYSVFSGGNERYSPDEIFSHKNIEPDKERCPYYFEHQLSKWSNK